MNIIDAWKIAKEGQSISRRVSKLGINGIKKDSYKGLGYLIQYFGEDTILADDWEVVRKKEICKTTWGNLINKNDTSCVFQSRIFQRSIPNDAIVSIEWEATDV